MKSVHLRFTVLLAALSLSCGGTFYGPDLVSNLSAEELMERIEFASQKIRTCRANAKIAIVSPEGSFRGSVRLRIKMPDSIWIKVEGILGVDVAVGSFGAGRSIFYMPRENVVYMGRIEALQEENILPLNLSSSDMILRLLGLFIPRFEGLDSTFSINKDGGRYLISYDPRERVWIRSRDLVVEKWERVNDFGDVVLSWEGRSFRRVKGIVLPRVVRITDYSLRRRVTLIYQTVRVNPSMSKRWFDIKIPDGVEVVEL